MNRKELIESLLLDHMNDSVYAVLYIGGERRLFSIDDVASKHDSIMANKFTACPTIVLREIDEDEL